MQTPKISGKDSLQTAEQRTVQATLVPSEIADNSVYVTAVPLEKSSYDELPTCRPYHPSSELSKMAGYYPNISADQLAAASQVLSAIKTENLNFNTDDEDTFLKILRFLRARKFNVKNAMTMIREDVSWRSQQNRLDLSIESAQDVLDCDIAKIYKYFPVWFQGFDKQMRPVSYRQFGKFEIWNVLKLTTMERLIRFHAWETEQALRSMYSLSGKSNYNIETFVLVIDAAGWNMKLATSDAFTFIKGMAVTDSDHYPERLGTLVLINAPPMLSFAWRIIQGFLDSVTKAKIRILSSDPEEWQPVLRQYIDVDQIPKQYGGTAPDLTPDEAIGAMNPSSSSAVEETGSFSSLSTPVRSPKSVCFSPVGTTVTSVNRVNKPKMVDMSVQTDEDVMVMSHEIARMKRAGCNIM